MRWGKSSARASQNVDVMAGGWQVERVGVNGFFVIGPPSQAVRWSRRGQRAGQVDPGMPRRVRHELEHDPCASRPWSGGPEREERSGLAPGEERGTYPPASGGRRRPQPAGFLMTRKD